MTLLACKWVQLCSNLNILWHCPSLGLEQKLTCFSPVATAEFSKYADIIEWSTFTESSFSILNSSAGIPSPPLALFVVMLPKAHLTSHSRMSGSRWVITPSWLSGSWRSFLNSSSVYSCHVFLTSSASVRFILFLSFIVPIFAWNVPLVSLIFLKRSLVFPILLFSSIYFHCSLRKSFSSLLAILWNSAFRWVYLSFLPFASLLFSANPERFINYKHVGRVQVFTQIILSYLWALFFHHSLGFLWSQAMLCLHPFFPINKARNFSLEEIGRNWKFAPLP